MAASKREKLVRFLILSFIISLCAMIVSPGLSHLETPINSGWTTIIPTINGTIASGEWTDATVRDFTLEMRSRIDGTLSKTLDARLYVKNNWTHIYAAIEIFNDDYEAQNFANNWNGLALLFEDDHDGVVSAGDNGEGITTWTGSPFYSKNDLYYTGSYWDADLNTGKTEDGALAWNHTNATQGAIGNWTFEMMIPLVGTDGDAYDLDITTLPETVGFKIWFQEPSKGTDGVYPDDPAITKNIEEISNGATFGDLIFHPLYTLTITTTIGGTTTPAPGEHQYPYETVVDVLATPDAGYDFDHWELDTVDVGTDNPYSVLMDQNHTLHAVFVEELSTTISPTTASIILGDSVDFTSTVSGGTTPYSYQWYVDDNPVSGATSSSWKFTPTSTGIYYVHLKVTDYRGRTATSNIARVTVTSVPVGGYSVSLSKQTSASPFVCYTILLMIFSAIVSIIKHKRK